MPQTISKTNELQIIGGVFSDREKADKALSELRDAGVPDANIQVVALIDGEQAGQAYTDAMVGRGIAENQARFYDRAVRDGKTFVAVHGVTEPGPVIDIFDDNGAVSNPDGSRNLRVDVAGLTAGAAVGAMAGGVAGTAVAGPLGGAVGAVAGAVVGAGAGGAAGKAVEHRK